MNEREEVARGMAEHQRKIHGGEAWPEGFLWLADWHLARVREARAQAFEEAANWLREMCPTRRAGADHDESICVHSRRADQMLETLAAREREVPK